MLLYSRYRKSLSTWAALGAMLAILVWLAYMQYTWSGQVSEAGREQIRRGIHASAFQLQSDFVRAVSQTCNAFYLGHAGSAEQMRLALLRHAGQLPRESLVRRLAGEVSLAFPNRQQWILGPVSGGAAGPNGWEGATAELASYADYMRQPATRRPRCVIDPDKLVLYSAVYDETQGAGDRILAVVLIRLESGYLEKSYLPELIKRHFGGGPLGFRAAIVRDRSLERVLYRTNPPPNLRSLSDADLVVNLFRPDDSQLRAPERYVPAVQSSVTDWQLAVQHPAGSLTAAGAKLRRRNLTLALGSLLFLAASAAFLMRTTQRARELADLHMQFVAGASHEFRTPVTAVCMIADNLADGMVETPEHARQYGRLLRQQGQRLTAMVESILLFTAQDRRGLRYDLKPLDVVVIIDDVVCSRRRLAEEAGMAIVQCASGTLPAALADSDALRQCLDNLIDNAVKYASCGGWVCVRAERADDAGEILVTVEDKGPGIEAGERLRVFEPYFRGAAARAACTPGTGLGLCIVSEMMRAMKGRVTVQANPGQGSSFTLHLAMADPANS